MSVPSICKTSVANNDFYWTPFRLKIQIFLQLLRDALSVFDQLKYYIDTCQYTDSIDGSIATKYFPWIDIMLPRKFWKSKCESFENNAHLWLRELFLFWRDLCLVQTENFWSMFGAEINWNFLIILITF